MAYTELEPRKRVGKVKRIRMYMNGCGKNAKIHIYQPHPFEPGQRVDILMSDDHSNFLLLGINKRPAPTGPQLTKTGSGLSLTSVPFYNAMGLKGRKFNVYGDLYKHEDGREGYYVVIPPIEEDNGYVAPVEEAASTETQPTEPQPSGDEAST